MNSTFDEFTNETSSFLLSCQTVAQKCLWLLHYYVFNKKLMKFFFIHQPTNSYATASQNVKDDTKSYFIKENESKSEMEKKTQKFRPTLCSLIATASKLTCKNIVRHIHILSSKTNLWHY